MGLVLIGGVVGYLIGPPMVQAATNLVVIKDSNSARKARVLAGGAVKTRSDGGWAMAFPGWTERFRVGQESATACTAWGWLTGVVVNGPSTGSTTVTLTGDDADTDRVADDVMWEGTVQAGDRLFDSFMDGGVVWGSTLTVTVSGDTPGRWLLYGYCRSATSILSSEAREAFRQMTER